MVTASLSQIIAHLFPQAKSWPLDYAVADDGSGQRIVRWNADALGPQPTPEELETHRAETEAALDALQAARSSPGYIVPEIDPPLVLDDSEVAQGRFAALITLIQVGMSAGVIANDTTQTIADKSGAIRQLPTGQLLQIILGYGQHCAARFAATQL